MTPPFAGPRRPARPVLRRVALAAFLLAFGPAVVVAQDKAGEPSTVPASSAAGEKSHIKPAAERQIGDRERPTIKKKQEQKHEPEARGPAVAPDSGAPAGCAAQEDRQANRARHRAKGKKLRGEAMSLLDKFINESPDDAPDMAEALMRMGELEWEDARDQFLLTRLQQVGEDAQRPQRGDPPNPDYSRPRARFLRVLQELQDVRPVRSRALRRRLPGERRGASTPDALGRFNKILGVVPQEPLRSRRPHGARRVRVHQGVPGLQERVQRVRGGPEVQGQRALRHRAVQERLVPLAARAAGRGGEALPGRVQERPPRAARASDKRRQAEIDELQAEALKNLVAVFVEDEKNRAEDMYSFLVKAGGDKFAGSIVKALAEALYEQAALRARHRGLPAAVEARADELPTPTSTGSPSRRATPRWRTGPSSRKTTSRITRDYVAPDPKSKKKPSPWVKAHGPKTVAEASLAVEKQLRDEAVGLHAKAQADKNSKGEYAGAAAPLRDLSRELRQGRGGLRDRTSTSARSRSTTSKTRTALPTTTWPRCA